MPLRAIVKFLPRMAVKRDKYWLCIRMHSTMLAWRDQMSGKSAEFKAYKQLIADNMGLNEDQAKSLLPNNNLLLKIPTTRIINNCQICKDQNINLTETINDTTFLKLTEEDLENRIQLLKEMGAQHINTAMLMSTADRVHMITFKAYTGIPEDEDVAKNLYSHLHEPPPDVPPLEHLDEYMTVWNYRRRCLNHYLKWRLEIPAKNETFVNNMANRLKYKSFTRLKNCFDVLHNDVGMSVKMIRDRRCFEGCSPMDVRKILDTVTTICDIPIRDLFIKSRIMYKIKYDNVLSAKRLLEEHGFSSEQLENCVEILFLHPANLKSGLNLMKNTPELKILCAHPQVLRILLSKDKVSQRMLYLRYLNVRDATVGILAKSVAEFDRSIRSGATKTRGKDIGLTLQKHLESDVNDIEKKLRKHPFWRNIDLLTIHSTLDYLRSQFEIDDILNNLQLLLHSKERVQSELIKLIELNNTINEENRYSPSQLLALCAYQIEKGHHFTGNGVWDNGDPNTILENAAELVQIAESQISVRTSIFSTM